MSEKKSFDDICAELGLWPQFLYRLSENTAPYYDVFSQSRRSGGVRLITASNEPLKSIQRVLAQRFLSSVSMPPYVHGCVKGRSVLTNAMMHVGKELVVNFDFSDFFNSIKKDRVESIFVKYFNCDDNAAQVLAAICTFNGALPVGAPTSPALANLVALEFDQDAIALLENVFEDKNFAYSRYVDDVTISGGELVQPLIKEVLSLAAKHGFSINSKKTRFLRQNTQQKVTGVVVNEKPNVPKKLLRKLRQELYYCNKFTVEDHCQLRNLNEEQFLSRLKGMISYVRIARPDLVEDRLEPQFVSMKRAKEEDPLEKVLYRLIRAIQDKRLISLTQYLASFDFGYDDYFYDDEVYARTKTYNKVAPLNLIQVKNNLHLHCIIMGARESWELINLNLIADVQLLEEHVRNL